MEGKSNMIDALRAAIRRELQEAERARQLEHLDTEHQHGTEPKERISDTKKTPAK